MRKYIIIFLFSCFNTSCVYSQKTNDIRIVVISSLERVLQDDIDVNGTTTAEIFCAKNEYESFQIIIANPTDRPVSQIDINMGKWHFTGTPGEGVPETTLYREHYVEIKRSSGNSNRPKGMYPDALIPFVDPYTSKEIINAKYLAKNQNINAKTSQGYWIDVYVGRDVKPGIYSNEINVLADGKVIKQIPVTLNVWDFELPEVHKLKTLFCKLRYVYMYHGLTWGDNKREVIDRRYLLMLRDHGISLPFNGDPDVNQKTGDVNFTFQYIRALKAYTEEMHPCVTLVTLHYYPFSEDSLKCAKYLSQWESFIQQNPWIPQPIVYIDEPASKEAYQKIIKFGKAINVYAPSIKLLVTEQIRPQKPNWLSLEGAVDIWVPTWDLADSDDIKRCQQAGDEVWSYSALVHEGVPNWLIDFPLLDYRIPAWFSWSLNLKGLLYWQTTAWSKQDVKIDPWIDPRTYLTGGKVWNGEGSLLYPGADAGIDGPVASMRLKVLRDGIEDFDYFAILKQKVGDEQVVSLVRKIASDFTTYSNSPSDYISVRKAVAEKIIQKR